MKIIGLLGRWRGYFRGGAECGRSGISSKSTDAGGQGGRKENVQNQDWLVEPPQWPENRAGRVKMCKHGPDRGTTAAGGARKAISGDVGLGAIEEEATKGDRGGWSKTPADQQSLPCRHCLRS